MSNSLVSDLAAERREAILLATVRCIARLGYDGVRLKDVSKEAGVSVGLVQHYFESRDALVDDAIAYGNDQLTSQWDDADAGSSARQRVVSSVHRIAARDDLRDVSVLWVEFARAAIRHEHLRERYRAVYRAWEEHFHAIVLAGIEDGSFRPILEPREAVAVLMAYFDGYELEVATGVVDPDTSDFVTRSTAFALSLFGAAH